MGEKHTGCEFVGDHVTLGDGAEIERHHIIGSGSWKRGATAPGESFEVLFPTLDFATGADDAAHYVLHVPYRRKALTNIHVELRWMHDNVAQVGKVLWKCTYLSVGCGDATNGAGVETSILTDGNHAQDEVLCDTLAPEILDANLTADDDLALKIWRNGSDITDTLGEAARLLSVHVHIIQDKLGLGI